MYKFLTTVIIAGLLLQSCTKKSGSDGPNPQPVDPGPVETSTMKLIPDSAFRVYLKANVCPNAFDKTGKLIDITHSEVKNFTGTMRIDTFTCPKPFVYSLKGIEYFTKMTKLIVQNSPLDSLNLTATMSLDTLRILNCKDLQWPLLSGCTGMRYIRASYIPAASLDLSNLPALNYVNLITLNRLSALKLDNDANLQHLMTFGLSSLNTMNLSTNTNLRRLYLEEGKGINSIDITHNQKLSQLIATYCPSLKRVDLSKNDSLKMVSFEGCGVDSVDFSHNPELFSVVMMWTPVRNLDLYNNPKLHLLWLDGCNYLQNIDIRAQTSWDYWFVPTSDLIALSQDDMYQIYQNGYASPVQTAQYHVFAQASRAGVNGATQNLYAGLRVPQYLDAGGLSLKQIKINDAAKDNYSLVMARRVFASMAPVQVTVYAADKTTVLCNDYDPTLFKCN